MHTHNYACNVHTKGSGTIGVTGFIINAISSAIIRSKLNLTQESSQLSKELEKVGKQYSQFNCENIITLVELYIILGLNLIVTSFSVAVAV